MWGFRRKRSGSSYSGNRFYVDAIKKLGYVYGNPYGFVPGCAYLANSTPRCKPQQIVVMAGGRDSGGRMTFTRVGGIASGQVKAFDGHETAVLRFADGGEFFVSAAVPADVDEASRIIGMVRGK